MAPDRIAFTTAADFFRGMLEPNYREFLRDQTDLRLAFNAAISLFHMADWVFHTRTDQIRGTFKFKDRPVGAVRDFCNVLEQINPDFGRIRGIANASKHLRLNDIRPVQNAPRRADNLILRIATATAHFIGFLPVPAFGKRFSTKVIVLEDEHGNGMDFSTIATSAYDMWKQLNEIHKWW
jgi:hypothetical protein